MPGEPVIAGKGKGIADLSKAIRKISNENARSIVASLETQPMTFGELHQNTGIQTNDLNRALYDMQQLDLVIPIGDKKGVRKYHLTKYGNVVKCALERLCMDLSDISREEMYSAFTA